MKFHVYKDHKGEWRWRLKAANDVVNDYVLEESEGSYLVRLVG